MSEKTTILIVDDNENLCKILSSILRHKGYDVTIATDGLEAIQIISRKPHNIILMDVKMPLINGIDTHLHIKKKGHKIKTILMTAYTTEERIKEYLHDGIYGIIFKPVDINVMLTLIEEIHELNRSDQPNGYKNDLSDIDCQFSPNDK